MGEMTQIEKFKRWAAKREWFLFLEGTCWIKYVLPDGRVVWIDFTKGGNLLQIEAA